MSVKEVRKLKQEWQKRNDYGDLKTKQTSGTSPIKKGPKKPPRGVLYVEPENEQYSVDVKPKKVENTENMPEIEIPKQQDNSSPNEFDDLSYLVSLADDRSWSHVDISVMNVRRIESSHDEQIALSDILRLYASYGGTNPGFSITNEEDYYIHQWPDFNYQTSRFYFNVKRINESLV